MKKLLLIASLLFASYGVFADDPFDTFVENVREEARTSGHVVRADRQHRMVFIDIRLPAEAGSLDDAQFAELKSELLKEAREDKDIAAVKERDVTLVFNFITGDGKIRSVVIAPADL